jgi:cytochrome c-type biogenesis protein CcmH/NrfG
LTGKRLSRRSFTGKARDNGHLRVLQHKFFNKDRRAMCLAAIKPKNMRPAFVIVIAVLFVALLAFDTYEYDGHYRAAAWEQAKQGVEQLEHQLDDLIGTRDH